MNFGRADIFDTFNLTIHLYKRATLMLISGTLEPAFFLSLSLSHTSAMGKEGEKSHQAQMGGEICQWLLSLESQRKARSNRE
ncbi:unnamed protein product [Arctogadus glacialis]